MRLLGVELVAEEEEEDEEEGQEEEEEGEEGQEEEEEKEEEGEEGAYHRPIILKFTTPTHSIRHHFSSFHFISLVLCCAVCPRGHVSTTFHSAGVDNTVMRLFGAKLICD